MRKSKSKAIKVLFTFSLGLVSSLVFAQQLGKTDLKRMFDLADSHLEADEFQQALAYFSQIDSLEPENYNVDFKIGMCYLGMPFGRVRSIPFFENAAEHTSPTYKEETYSEKNAPQITNFYLGQAYHLNYEFDKAIKVYEVFKSQLGAKEIEPIREVDRYIKYSDNAKVLVQSPIKIKIENLGNTINTEYPDYAPVISADEKTLIFTSRRPGSIGAKLAKDGMPYEDIYISKKVDDIWTRPVGIGKNINSDGHEASIGLSPDGQQLYIYKDDIEGGGNIYYSTLRGEIWGSPIFLDNINTYDWEPSAAPSADGTKLYFTSNMKGGYGGRDIYVSYKLPSGEWSLPENMGPKINTPYDEDGPFIHPDGKTLFFSSKAHNSMGGFDVFFTVYDEKNKEWSKPINIGYPVNTPDDDIYYSLTPDGKRAYYSSFQQGGFGEKDIYMLEFLDQKEIPLVLFKGTVKDKEGNVPDDVIVMVTDNETSDLVGSYLPNSKTGEYVIILPPGADYNIAYEASGYLFKSENINVPADAAYSEIEKAIELPKLEVGQKIVLNNIFFDTNKSTVRTTSKVELNKLYDLMMLNPTLTVEISGHTDHVGNDSYNKKLSQERAQAVVDYLVSKNIPKNRLRAMGYGEEKPIAANTNQDGSNNEENMQLNRRVEMEVIGIVAE